MSYTLRNAIKYYTKLKFIKFFTLSPISLLNSLIKKPVKENFIFEFVQCRLLYAHPFLLTSLHSNITLPLVQI